MFYAQFVLSKKGPLAKIWLAAHWEKKLSKTQIYETNVESAVDEIMKPKVRMALRTTGHLLLGIVRIYSRKAKYLLADCNEAFLKIKMAFRPGQVDLPEEGREAQANAITLPEVFHDFDSALPDFNSFPRIKVEEVEDKIHKKNQKTSTAPEPRPQHDLDAQLALNQSRIDDITMKEDIPNRSANLFGQDFTGIDDFGEGIVGGGGGGVPAADASFISAGGASSIAAEVPRDAGSHSMDHRQLERGGADHVGGGGGRESDLLGDFGTMPEFGELDEQLFNDDLFNDEALKAVEGDIGAPGLVDDDGDDGLGGIELNDEIDHDPLGVNTSLPKTNDESFILEPLDHSVMAGLERHRGKRKRKLIIDEVKNITGDEMKQQMQDYVDTVQNQMDLAPPTKQLMRWKETGAVDKLFNLPAFAQFASAHLHHTLVKQYQSVLKPKARISKRGVDEEKDEDQLILPTHVDGAIEPVPGDIEDAVLLERIEEEPALNGAEQFEDIDYEHPMPSVSPIAADGDESEAVSSKDKKKESRKSRQDKADESETADDAASDADTDRRWTKRTQTILNGVKNKLAHQPSVAFTELSKGATRKSAAQKFYTLLVLKKWQAIDVDQPEPYGDIVVTAGPHIDSQPPQAVVTAKA